MTSSVNPLTLEGMPTEIFGQIVRHLDTHSLCNLAETSKDIYNKTRSITHGNLGPELATFVTDICSKLDPKLYAFQEQSWGDIQKAISRLTHCTGVIPLQNGVYDIKEQIFALLLVLSKKETANQLAIQEVGVENLLLLKATEEILSVQLINEVEDLQDLPAPRHCQDLFAVLSKYTLFLQSSRYPIGFDMELRSFDLLKDLVLYLVSHRMFSLVPETIHKSPLVQPVKEKYMYRHFRCLI